MAAIAQTIAIYDKSGKVVSTSKQLKSVWAEAKLAYQERRAEIVSDRHAREDKELRKAIKAMSIADEEERDHSEHRRHGASTSDRRPRHRPELDRNPSSRSVKSNRSGTESPRHQGQRNISAEGVRSNSPRARPRSGDASPEYDYYSPSRSSTPSAARSSKPLRMSNELVRRRTDFQVELAPPKPPRPASLLRSSTSPNLARVSNESIDLDLAYGEFHPESISPSNTSLPDLNKSRSLVPRPREQRDKEELSSLVLKCKMLLDEANCAQHSVKAVILHLQKNPDAMAAVALTLAEISNLASKMAPGFLMSMKAGAPAVFTLLAAPEFLIAVGVGVGLTVVMFGGYKIIKKIAAKAKGDIADDLLQSSGRQRQGSMDEIIDVEELSHIEHWRRGIADNQFDSGSMIGKERSGSMASKERSGSVVSAVSNTTSVEGEYISPAAARSLGHLPLPKKKKSKVGSISTKKDDGEKRRRRKRSDSGQDSSQATSVARSTVSDREKKDKALVVKVKKPSPLRRMFKGEGSSVAS